MKIKALFKYFKNKKEFLLIIVLTCICVSFLSAISFSANILQEKLVRRTIENEIVDFCYLSNEYEETHENVMNYIETRTIFEIEKNFTLDFARIRDINISFEYIDSNDTFRQNFEFQNIFMMGIDEYFYDYLQGIPNNPIIGLPDTWERFENQIAIPHYFLDYSSIYHEFQILLENNTGLIISNNLSNTLNVSSEFSSPFLTNEVQIYDEDRWFNIFLGSWGFGGPNLVIVSEKNAMESLIYSNNTILPGVENYTAEIFVFDRENLYNQQPAQINDQMSQLRRFTRGDYYSTSVLDANSPWMHAIGNIVSDRMNFIIFMVIFYIPIIILTYKYVKHTISMIFENNDQEIKLLNSQGMTKREIKKYYLQYLSLLGFIGGGVGGICGLFISFYIRNSWFFEQNQSFQIFLSNYQFSDLWTILLYALISALIVYKSSESSLKNLYSKRDKDFIHFGEKIQWERSIVRKYYDFIILGLAGITIILLIVYKVKFGKQVIIDFNDINNQARTFSMVLTYNLPFMFLFAFLVPISLIRQLNKARLFLFRKITILIVKIENIVNRIKIGDKKSKFKSENSKSRYNLLEWRLRNQSEKQRMKVEIYAITIIFISVFISLNNSYLYSRSVYESTITANGAYLEMTLTSPESISNISEDAESYENLAKNYGIDSMNVIYHTQENAERYRPEEMNYDIEILDKSPNSFWYYQFSTTNYSMISNLAVLRDEWFIGGSSKEILTKMEQDDAILIPSYLLENTISLNETLRFQFTNAGGQTIIKTGKVIGAYHIFPTVMMQRHYDYEYNLEFFMSNNLLLEARVNVAELLFYTENGEKISDIQMDELKRLAYEEFSHDLTIYEPNWLHYYNEFDPYLFKFLALESDLFIMFGVIGLILFSFLAYGESNLEFGLLRARGYTKKDIYKLLIQEIGMLGLSGLLYSFLLFLCFPILLLALNRQRWGGFDEEFYIYTKYNWLINFIIIFSGFIVFLGINLAFSFISLKKTDVRESLDQILRIRT
ncbi:MAG: FtsX-like permease family protein [Promethearchaeota archaeon]